MIVVRSPLRITLGGGGTDLPSYYRKHGGFVISGAIDKYIYITLHETFEKELIIKYSKLEKASNIDEINHPIIRETLKLLKIDNLSLEITSLADIPSGTGLGSSGSFTTALLHALHIYKKNIVTKEQIAIEACNIEINRLHEPVGKQDQYISAFGGLTCFEFNKDDSVKTYPAPISKETQYNLEDSLMLFFTGYSRKSSDLLNDQDQKTKEDDSDMIKNLHFVKELGLRSLDALSSNNLNKFAKLMHEHWENKRNRSSNMSNNNIDNWYNIALQNGAIGGKLIGAGGGGFLMLYTNNKPLLRQTMNELNLREVRFKFDNEGTKAVIQ